jgi:type VI secretion system protein VasD
VRWLFLLAMQAYPPYCRAAGWSRRHLLGGGVVLLLSACGSKPKPGEPPAPPSTGGLFKPSIASVGGDMVAAADLNPSGTGRPSPLPLRIFELKAATAFNKADFLPLYQTELQALGDELLNREEVVLAPGETRTMQKVLNPETRFIGVFGAYRSFERATWRAIAPVQPGKKHQVQIRAASLAVSIQLQVV